MTDPAGHENQPMTKSKHLFTDMSLLQTITLSALLLALMIHLLVFAEDVLLPLTFGFFLSVLLYTPLRLLEKLYVPKSVGALLLISLLTGLIVAGGYSLQGTAQEFLRSMPQTIEKLRAKTFEVEQAIEDVQQKTSEVESALSDVMESTEGEVSQVVITEDLSLQDRVAKEVARVLWLLSVTLLLCYFFLVGGDALIRNVASMFSTRRKQVQTFQLFRSVREHLSSYLGVTMMVNLGYGLVIGVILFFLDIELALLWGLGAGMLRYVPFIGTIITMTLIIAVTLTYHDDIKIIVLVPCVVLAINFITGNLVDPLVHSHQFQLNPIAIFVSIIFWGWIWGAAGLFIAVPSLITAAVIFQRIPPLAKLYLVICLTPIPEKHAHNPTHA